MDRVRKGALRPLHSLAPFHLPASHKAATPRTTRKVTTLSTSSTNNRATTAAVHAEPAAATTGAEVAGGKTRAHEVTPNGVKGHPAGLRAGQTDQLRDRTPIIQTIAGTTTITWKRPLTVRHPARSQQTIARDRETAGGGADNLLGRSPR